MFGSRINNILKSLSCRARNRYAQALQAGVSKKGKNTMIKINIKKHSNHAFDPKILRKKIVEFLRQESVTEGSLTVASVGGKKALEISNKYLKDGVAHNVLSFPSMETKVPFASPPDSPIDLGEIVICYPIALQEALDEQIRIDEKVSELVLHGVEHLMGHHHT